MAKKKETKAKNDKTFKNLSDLKDAMESKWGDGAVMSLSDNWVVDVNTISSGSISMDCALGVGGYPRGRLIEIFGPYASGKTTLALHAIASAQKDGGTVAFVDAEHALDPAYSVKLGVNIDSALVSQPDCGEDALEQVELFIESGIVDIVVVDSIAALTPRAELEGEVGQNFIGGQARMMSQFLRRIVSKVKKSQTNVIFINQIRNKIGVMFGSPETTPGGNAMKYYASVRVDIRKGEPIKNGDELIGHMAKIKIVKNKVATPFKTCEVPIIYGKGIDYEIDLINSAKKLNIIKTSGSWYTYGEQRLGNGIANTCEFLRDNKDMKNEISNIIKEKMWPDVKKINIEDTHEDEIENTLEE